MVSSEQSLMTLRELRLAGFSPGPATRLSLELWSTAHQCQEGGLSGRALRKVGCTFISIVDFADSPINKSRNQQVGLKWTLFRLITLTWSILVSVASIVVFWFIKA